MICDHWSGWKQLISLHLPKIQLKQRSQRGWESGRKVASGAQFSLCTGACLTSESCSTSSVCLARPQSCLSFLTLIFLTHKNWGKEQSWVSLKRAWCPRYAPTSLPGESGCLETEWECVPLPQKASKIKITPKSLHSAWKHSAEPGTMIIGKHNSSSEQF